MIREKYGLPVFHEVPYGCELIIAIGDSRVRYELVKKLEKCKINYCTAIHSSAVISKYSKVVVGTIVIPGAIINAFAEVSNHCVVNTNASVGHETILGDYAIVCPNSDVCDQRVIGDGLVVVESDCYEIKKNVNMIYDGQIFPLTR